jgi:hypothetical protein
MRGSWAGGPSSTPWLTWLCDVEHDCPAGKKQSSRVLVNIVRSEGSKFSSRTTLYVAWFMRPSQKTNLPRFQPCWGTPRLSPILHQISQWVQATEILWKIGDDLGVLQQGWNRGRFVLRQLSNKFITAFKCHYRRKLLHNIMGITF